MTIGISRRQFISALGGVSLAWPLAAQAQQPAKLPIIGVLGANASLWKSWTAAFVARLHELGWIEGRTIAIEYRWAEGRPEGITEAAADFVRLKADVILTFPIAIPIIKQATPTTPIVFPISNDPLGTGLVANLSRPGGNITGLSLESVDIGAKRLEYLRQIVPNLRRLAILVNVGYPVAVLETDEVQAAARRFGFEVVLLEIRRAEDIAAAVETLNGRADALYIVQDALVVTGAARIIAIANSARLPTMFAARDFVQDGALMSYGASFSALFRRAADYVDKILHGTKPGDIPVEQPTKFDLVVNLKTAKALGLTIPHDLLVLADEVIE
jgi:putative ABC transport system substrate-binding protein